MAAEGVAEDIRASVGRRSSGCRQTFPRHLQTWRRGNAQRRKFATRIPRKRREEISQHLSDRLIHDDNYFLGLLLQLGDTKKASRIVDLAHELREYLAEQMRHVAAILIQRNTRAYLVRRSVQRNGVLDKMEWAQHYVVFQASDHGREDFRSGMLAAFTLTIGLSQVLAMSPFVPEPDGGLGGVTLIEYSLPFGLGHGFQTLKEMLPEDLRPALRRPRRSSTF